MKKGSLDAAAATSCVANAIGSEKVLSDAIVENTTGFSQTGTLLGQFVLACYEAPPYYLFCTIRTLTLVLTYHLQLSQAQNTTTSAVKASATTATPPTAIATDSLAAALPSLEGPNPHLPIPRSISKHSSTPRKARFEFDNKDMHILVTIVFNHLSTTRYY